MIGLLRLGLIGVGGFLYATSLTGAYAAECAVPLDCYTKSLQQLQLAKDIVAKPLDELIALRKKIDDLEGKLQTEENARKAADLTLEGKVGELALAQIDVLVDHSDPTPSGVPAKLGCERVGGKLVAGSCVGESLSGGQAAVGPLFMSPSGQPAIMGVATYVECRSYNHNMPMTAFAVCVKKH